MTCPREGRWIGGCRVTKIVCPSCEGTGVSPLLNGLLACTWCRGDKRLTVDRSKAYASQLYNLSFGYVLGDLDFDESREMIARAEAVYRAVGFTPPWIGAKTIERGNQ